MFRPSPKMQIVWQVLESAKDTGDEFVIAAARRLIRANTLGWRKHANAADYALMIDFLD